MFEQVKEAVISDTTLRYFDPSLPVTIQVDASQVGFSAALLQNGKPVAFASKALTNTECQYTNIEREMLAAVFGAERFHTYVYGQSFTIESDHKLLESISRKNLADTCMATTHDVMPTGIRFHNPLLPRQRNGHTRHALSIQSLPRPRPSTGYCYPSCPHHARLQRSLPTSLCE